jgi:hypothetical protein
VTIEKFLDNIVDACSFVYYVPGKKALAVVFVDHQAWLPLDVGVRFWIGHSNLSHQYIQPPVATNISQPPQLLSW